VAAPWPAPQPIPSGLPSVPAFDERLLPSALAPWVADIAERAQCPPDFVAIGALVAAAAVIGRQVAIRPKRADDWTVIPNLWGLAVGRPGLMKSAALAEALKPLAPLSADARITYERERVAHHRDALSSSSQYSPRSDAAQYFQILRRSRPCRLRPGCIFGSARAQGSCSGSATGSPLVPALVRAEELHGAGRGDRHGGL